MGRITDSFKKLKKEGRKAFVGYVMVGCPDLEASKKLALDLLEKGADVLELGMPFSDPLADGPVIQQASEDALKNHVTMDHVFELAEEIRKISDKPLLIMSYLNPVLAIGGTLFLEKAIHAGIDGAIIPDLPPEEADGFASLCKAADFDMVFLAAPTSDAPRVAKIAKMGSGFIYVVSVTGVTGERDSFDAQLNDTIKRLRAATRVPLVIGFGVSTPDNAREAGAMADGVVVASAVLRAHKENGHEAAIAKASELIDAVHDLKG